MGSYFSATDISASGLTAERLRMEVVANNLANAHTTRTADGGPYRRQQVLFQSMVGDALGQVNGGQFRGVKVLGVEPDQSDFAKVYQPGHPDADKEGFVLMPNVSTANEMVDLITASRAYEANLKALQSFRQITENALSLLRS